MSDPRATAMATAHRPPDRRGPAAPARRTTTCRCDILSGTPRRGGTSAIALITHRSASGTALARALAEVLRRPARRPVRARGRRRPGQGRRAVAGPAALARARRRPTATGSAPTSISRGPSTLLDDARAGGLRRARRGGRAVGAGTGAVAAARRARRGPRRASRWCRVAGPPPRHRRGEDKGRRLAVARRLAGLFDEYGQSRPGDAARLGATAATSAATAHRWTTICAGRPSCGAGCATRLGTPCPAELLDDACRRLRAQPGLSALPEPLSVFGASRLSPARLQRPRRAGRAPRRPPLAAPLLARAVGRGRRRTPPCAARDDRTARRPGQPAAHLAVARRPRAAAARRPDRAGSTTRPARAGSASEHTLLGRLQQDLADDRVAVPTRRRWTPRDRSVQVHACHGRTRQVEVLREVVLGLLADDPTLEPRDILVMCPDVETFAPLIAAAFALGAEDDAAPPGRRGCASGWPTAPSPRPTRCSPCCPSCSSSAPPASPPPGARPRRHPRGPASASASTTTSSSGCATGPSAPACAGASTPSTARTWQLGDLAQGTWRAGLDRMLLGVAMEGDLDSWGGVLPLDDVDSADIDLAGRLAELVDRVDRRAGAAVRPAHRVATGWPGSSDAVTRAGAPRRDAAWQQLQLRRELADVAEAADGSTALLGAGRRPRAAADTPRRPADPRELPHRHPDRLHAGADALGAAPGGVPARPRRRRVPPPERAATATTCWPATRGSASATRAARTASSCSTRSAPPGSTS